MSSPMTPNTERDELKDMPAKIKQATDFMRTQIKGYDDVFDEIDRLADKQFKRTRNEKIIAAWREIYIKTHMQLHSSSSWEMALSFAVDSANKYEDALNEQFPDDEAAIQSPKGGEAVPVGYVYYDATGRKHFTSSKVKNGSQPIFLHPTAYKLAIHSRGVTKREPAKNETKLQSQLLDSAMMVSALTAALKGGE